MSAIYHKWKNYNIQIELRPLTLTLVFAAVVTLVWAILALKLFRTAAVVVDLHVETHGRIQTGVGVTEVNVQL